MTVDRGIYTDGLAELLKKRDGQPWRPSNGTEGDIFMRHWCNGCQRDADYRAEVGDSCPIICNAMVYDTDDPNYPAEWRYGDDGQPLCTAFEAVR